MDDTLKIKTEIVKVLFYANAVFLAVAIISPTKTLFILGTSINILLSGTVLIMDNWANRFMIQFEKMWGK